MQERILNEDFLGRQSARLEDTVIFPVLSHSFTSCNIPEKTPKNTLVKQLVMTRPTGQTSSAIL